MLDIEKLYRTYYMQIYSYVMTIVKSQHDAEEITQQTFYKAMTTKSKFEQKSSEFTWLCSIAKHIAIDTIRKQKKVTEFYADSSPSLETEFSKQIEEAHTAIEIHQVLHTLPEPYKEVFQLRVFGELSFAQIAQIFGKTENWARVTYHRARLKMQERMERYES